MAFIYNKSLVMGGNFQDAQGNPLSCGYLLLTLSHDSCATLLGSPQGMQVVSTTVRVNLDNTGNASNGQYIWSNSALSPPGSFYFVKAFNNQGLQVWDSPQQWTITYASVVNIGAILPNIP